MANFQSFSGSPITHGVSTGLAIKQRKKEAEAVKQRDQAEQFVKAHNDRLATIDEKAKQVLEATKELSASGANDEQLKPLRVLYTTTLANRAALEQNFKATVIQSNAPPEVIETLPDGAQAVQTRMPFFDAAVQIGRGELEQEQVRTLTPEETEALSPGLPKGSIVQQKPSGELVLTFEPSADDDLSSLQEKTQALMKTGLDEQRALGIASGRYQVSVNPTTNERVVFDMGTGEPVGDPVPPPSEGDVPGLIPEDIEAPLATGGPGALKNVANIFKGAFNAGPTFPKAQEASEALRTVQTMTGIMLQAEVPGRPSNFLLQELKKLTVTPNSIFQGDELSKTRFEQTKRLLDGEIARMEQDVLPLELPPDIRVNTQVNLTQLKRLRDAYDGILTSFEEKAEEEETEESGGPLSPEVKSLVDKYAPEGQAQD